jgi:hypothetical protein
LIAEPEDEDAGQDLFGREQAEAAGVPPELHLCGGRGVESDIGQSIRKRGVTCLIEGRKPLVEEVAAGGVGDEAHLVTHARQANDDGGMNGADVRSGGSGLRSAGGIAEDDGVDLVWIVIVFLAASWGGAECGAAGAISAGAGGTNISVFAVTQGIKDRGKRADDGNDSEQDGSGAERLAASYIEVGSGEWGDARLPGLPDKWVVLGFSRGEPSRRRSGRVDHTNSVDARTPKRRP